MTWVYCFAVVLWLLLAPLNYLIYGETQMYLCLLMATAHLVLVYLNEMNDKITVLINRK